MSRTTDEWEALLDGTTEGPWEVETVPEMRYYDGETSETPGYHAIHGGDEVLFAVPDEFLAIGDSEYDNGMNARLAAHAPAAVAEVIRLRREINEIRRFVENFPLMPPLIGTGSTEARAYEMQEKVSHALTHILEGDTDE